MEKYQHMKSFIKSAAEYSKNRSEVTSNAIQRLLQMLGVTSDMSIFDAGSIITAEFYISLHELMSGLDSRSSLVWCAIGVLQHACHNPAARHALIHVYKFTPILTRLLGANLTHDKKLRVLQLLQELTYGVKISWQEAHLPHLISTLTSFITSSEKDVICTSLGVLVNLCYKNLPAVYTLMRCVDTKNFLRTILRLQDENPNIRVQVCKLLIILEHISGEVPSSDILNFVNVTFSTLGDAFKNKDIFLLRHIVDFFNDVKTNQVSRKTLLTYNGFSDGTAKLLELLASDSSDPECVGMIFGFLHSLVNLQISCLANLYPHMVSLAFQWIQTELACTQSLSLIRSITMNAAQDKMDEIRNNIFDQLDQGLSILLLILDTGGDESFPTNTDCRSRVTALLQLLQEMCKIQNLMQKILSSVKPQVVQKLFEPLLSIEPQDEMNLFQEEVTTLYVHALDFLSDFASVDAQWLSIYSNLLQKKQVQMVLAVALYTGKEDLKREVLGLTGTIGFPVESVSSLAKSLCDLEPLVLLPVQSGSGSSRLPNAVTAGSNAQQQPPNMTPLFSLAQEGRLDNFIAKLNEAAERNEIHDISTSAVMELYEYKLAAMGQSERALQASLEAANNHSTHLQHRLAQMSAEASRLHQLLYHTQQCLEGLQKEKEVLQTKLDTTQTKADAAHKKYVQDIKSSQQMVSDLTTANDELKRKLQVKYEELAELQHQKEVLSKQLDDLKTEIQLLEQKHKEQMSKNAELTRLMSKLEERVSKRERVIEDKNSEIDTLQKSIQALHAEVQHLTTLCKAHEKSLQEKEMELNNTHAQLTELQRIREVIYEISAGKKKMDK